MEEVRTAVDYGFDFIGAGDSQSVALDAWMTLVEIARLTDKPLLGPCVTNTMTRHPSVTVSAAATLYHLSQGRATVLIGRGASAAENVGRRALPVDSTAQYMRAVRALLDGQPATWDGATLYSGWAPSEIPLFLSAAGPKMLDLAGETCDGIVFTGGVEPDRVRTALADLRRAASAHGRDPARLECWQLLRTSVHDSREEALNDIKPLLSSAFHNLRRDDPSIPDELREPLAEMARRYDARYHVVPGPNVDLMDRLGLTDYLATRFGVYGTPSEVAQHVTALAEAGVTRVLVPDVGTPDPMMVVDRFGREVMPLCQ
jgi:5,10-methylenetetrahydromethanopterin reductase